MKSYNSEAHFKDVLYHSRKWVKEWKELNCNDITSTMIEDYIIRRSKVSPIVANMGSTFYNRKVDRPPFDVLKAEINKLGYSAVGRKYGVSDNAIRKWLKAYEQKQSTMNNVRTKKVTHRVTHKKKKGLTLTS